MLTSVFWVTGSVSLEALLERIHEETASSLPGDVASTKELRDIRIILSNFFALVFDSGSWARGHDQLRSLKIESLGFWVIQNTR